MKTRAFLLASIFCSTLCVLAGASAVHAAPCAGFADIDSTDPFCPNVEWLKNRKITLGCGAPGYCPTQAVSRLSMAAFMNRLGVALTPTDLPLATAAATVLDLSSVRRICPTPVYATADYPRRAYVTGTVNLSAPTAGINIRADVVVSLDGGSTWTTVGPSDVYASLYSGMTPASAITLTPYAFVDLDVGDNVRFGLSVSRNAGSGNITAACSTAVRVTNRNGIAAPLDGPASAESGATMQFLPTASDTVRKGGGR